MKHLSPPSAKQLVTGVAVVPQQVPRAVNELPLFEVTVAPNVAVVFVIADDVGEESDGTLAV